MSRGQGYEPTRKKLGSFFRVLHRYFSGKRETYEGVGDRRKRTSEITEWVSRFRFFLGKRKPNETSRFSVGRKPTETDRTINGLQTSWFTMLIVPESACGVSEGHVHMGLLRRRQIPLLYHIYSCQIPGTSLTVNISNFSKTVNISNFSKTVNISNNTKQ